MAAPHPKPILSYTGTEQFGWREEDGDSLLVLPHHPNWSPLIEHAAGLMAATFFMLCICGLVAFVTRSIQPGDAFAVVGAVAVGLMAIANWAWVVAKCIRQAALGAHEVVVIRISSDYFDVTPLATRDGESCWPRGAIVDVQLRRERPSYFRPCRAALRIAFGVETSDVVYLPWPEDEPTELHEQRLRALLNLPSTAEPAHAQPYPHQARRSPGETGPAAGDVGAG